MINFYRQFIPRAAEYQSALHTALCGLISGVDANPWEGVCKLQASSIETNAFGIAARDAAMGLFIDASKTAAGATLQQRDDGAWQPQAF